MTSRAKFFARFLLNQSDQDKYWEWSSIVYKSSFHENSFNGFQATKFSHEKLKENIKSIIPQTSDQLASSNFALN